MLAAFTTAKSFLRRDLPSKIIGSALKLNYLQIEVLAYISVLLFLNASSSTLKQLYSQCCIQIISLYYFKRSNRQSSLFLTRDSFTLSTYAQLEFIHATTRACNGTIHFTKHTTPKRPSAVLISKIYIIVLKNKTIYPFKWI